MTLPDLMLICGTAVLGTALRSVGHEVTDKLGALAILATSFLTGYCMGGGWIGGLLLTSLWFFLPWLELLTRVRRMRIPSAQTLKEQSPPGHEIFPTLRNLSSEFEDAGFDRAGDMGWDWDGHRQFFRLFIHHEEKLEGAICLLEQNGIVFYYVSLSTRMPDGTGRVTWNYPFAYSLKTPPHLNLNRVRGDLSVRDLLRRHRDFLIRECVPMDSVPPPVASDFAGEIQQDMQLQISHNMRAGVLRMDAKGDVRYSLRGLFFLWIQFLRDLVRFS